MNARGSPFLCGLDMGFEILDLHDHAVRIGKGFYAGGPMGARGHVHKKDTKE